MQNFGSVRIKNAVIVISALQLPSFTSSQYLAVFTTKPWVGPVSLQKTLIGPVIKSRVTRSEQLPRKVADMPRSERPEPLPRDAAAAYSLFLMLANYWWPVDTGDRIHDEDIECVDWMRIVSRSCLCPVLSVVLNQLKFLLTRPHVRIIFNSCWTQWFFKQTYLHNCSTHLLS